MNKLRNKNILQRLNPHTLLKLINNIPSAAIVILFLLFISGCNYITHRTISQGAVYDSLNTDPEPNYNVSLDYEYQDFASYLFMGNRIENFTAYFNTFFKSSEDFSEAMEEYRAATISVFDSRLDSLGVIAPVSPGVKEKLNKAIERSSKIIQFHKNSKFIDDAVLLIGKSYYFLGDYINAERKFNEFISKLSSSENADEAVLYLSRSKMRLGSKDEAEMIVKNLVKVATDNEIKSLAARDLGIIQFNKRNIEESVNYFKSSIEFSDDDERKAESQFILAKILSIYKPQHAAVEYSKVLDYSSDFDLGFYAKLNMSKGLIYNKEFRKADDELQDLRKKYREVPAYTQLVDLEIANAYYGMKDLKQAQNKYFEVIVKYPNSIASSGAYYFLGKHEEEVNKNYIKALTNYQKSVSENNQSEYYNISAEKVKILDKYFELRGEIIGSEKITIPAANEEVEKYRIAYNKERGIEVPKETESTSGEGPKSGDGTQTGDGKGKPGGYKSNLHERKDTIEDKSKTGFNPGNNPGKNQEDNSGNRNERNPGIEDDLQKEKVSGITEGELTDTLNPESDSLKIVDEKNKTFTAYFEIAELFMYNLNNIDSAEYYLNYLLENFPESEFQSKVLYTLANFYKNNNKQADAEETFKKIVSVFPLTVYGYESKKILGIKTDQSDIVQKPIDEIFSRALELYNEKNYGEAIVKLYEVPQRFPNDSSVAKAYYGIGYVYENNLFNKDSCLHYYKLLKEKFPSSEYTLKITPKLEYIASLEVKDTTATDTTKSEVPDSLQNKEGEVKPEEKVSTGEEEVKPEVTGTEEGEKLTQEEIDKLLKETESEETGK